MSHLDLFFKKSGGIEEMEVNSLDVPGPRTLKKPVSSENDEGPAFAGRKLLHVEGPGEGPPSPKPPFGKDRVPHLGEKKTVPIPLFLKGDTQGSFIDNAQAPAETLPLSDSLFPPLNDCVERVGTGNEERVDQRPEKVPASNSRTVGEAYPLFQGQSYDPPLANKKKKKPVLKFSLPI